MMSCFVNQKQTSIDENVGEAAIYYGEIERPRTRADKALAEGVSAKNCKYPTYINYLALLNQLHPQTNPQGSANDFAPIKQIATDRFRRHRLAAV